MKSIWESDIKVKLRKYLEIFASILCDKYFKKILNDKINEVLKFII